MRKVVVLPHEVYESMQREPQPQALIDPKKQKLLDMEGELQSILNNPNIEIHEKKALYQHWLQKLLDEISAYKNYNERDLPIGIPLEKEERGETDSCRDSEDRVSCMIEHVMIGTIKTKGTTLYNAFKTHPTINWNKQTGEITVDNAPITGSNIVDICVDLVRRWKRDPPVGWDQIKTNIKRGGFPRTLILNPTRLDDLNMPNKPTITPPITPLTTRYIPKLRHPYTHPITKRTNPRSYPHKNVIKAWNQIR